MSSCHCPGSCSAWGLLLSYTALQASGPSAICSGSPAKGARADILSSMRHAVSGSQDVQGLGTSRALPRPPVSRNRYSWPSSSPLASSRRAASRNANSSLSFSNRDLQAAGAHARVCGVPW